MTKKIKLLTITLLGAIGISAIGVSVYFIVDQFTVKPTPLTSAYNDVANNLAELPSRSDFDRKTLDYYAENTGTLFVGAQTNLSVNSGNMGTIWNYPAPVGDYGYYFATNIHVVSDALVGSARQGNISLDHAYAFKVKTSLRSEEFQIMPEIAQISAYKDLKGVDPNAKVYNAEYSNNSWYSDFVILKTTNNIFNGENTINFLDTEAEYNWLSNKIISINNPQEELAFYICGFPGGTGYWPDAAVWTAIKYVWKPQIYYNKFPVLSSAAETLDSDYLNPNNKDGQGFGKPDPTWYKNYTRQLVLPKLNLGGGSSGSLLTVKYFNPTTSKDELMALGIYWGGYSSSNDTNKEPFLGGIDLFYAPVSAYKNSRYMALTYSNLLAKN